MHKSVLTGLRVASAALVGCGYLALATTPHYPVAIVFLPVVMFALLPLGERLDLRYPIYHKIATGLGVAFLAFVLISLFFYDLLSSVTALIIYIQAHTFLHRKGVRNYYHLFLMSFFMLLAACVMTPEPAIGLVMVAFLVSAVLACIMLHLYREIERSPGGAVAQVLDPDEREISIADLPQHPFEPGFVLALGGIAFVTVLAAAALFYVTPRMQAGLLGRTDPYNFRAALSNQTVDLSRGGRIVSDQRPVMHVEFPDEPGHRYEGGMFWRITTLNDYRASHWARRPFTERVEDPAFASDHPRHLQATHQQGAHPDAIARASLGPGHVIKQSIYMDDAPQEGVPALTLVERIVCTGKSSGSMLSWDDQGDFTVLLTRKGARWLQYDAWSEVQEFSPQELARVPDNYRDVLPQHTYGVLTFHTLEPRTQELARRITAGKTTVYDKVRAVGAYLNESGYFYSVDLPTLPPDHPVDSFIHDTKIGHCELFASAMALMLRSLGIPTRVVVGFRGGEWSDRDQSYVVLADMAHLWVEVYFIGRGWVTFDPSPPYEGPSGFAKTWLARTINRYMLRAKMSWYQNVIGFDRGLQFETLRNLAVGLIGYGSDLFDREPSPVRRSPISRLLWILGFMAVPAAIAGSVLLLRRRTGHGQQFMLTVDQIRAVRIYRHFRRKVERLGVAVRGKTAEELCEEIRVTGRLESASVREIIEAYNQTRFGGRPLLREHYTRLRRLVRSLEP